MNFGDLVLLKKYFSPYKRRLLLISGLAIICAFFEAINLGALVPLIQLMSGETQPGGTLYALLESAFSFIGIELNFINLLAMMTILFIIGQILLFQKKRLQVRLMFTLSADLKRTIFDNLLRADMKYLYSQKSGQFNTILTRESENAATSVYALTEIVTYIFFISVYSVMLLYVSVQMTIICLVLAALTMYFLNFLILRSEKLANIMVDTNTKLNEFITERLGLLKLVKIFSAEDIESQKFEKNTTRYSDQNTAFMVNGIKIETVFQVTIFSIAICILFLATFVFQIELAMLLVFIFIIIRLTEPLRQLNAQRHLIKGEVASLGMIDKILNDIRAAQTIKDGEKKFTGFKSSIFFEKVSFSYTTHSETIQEISFEIKKNEMVALVGSSGGGKSTIADLLIRVIEPDQGRILIDNVNLVEFNIESYHKKIGFVSQESLLFNDSVKNNICYGLSECNIDKVIASAQIANAHEFVLKLPLGYDTEIGERGVKLSGGEKQRIALARALYHDPEILILDEATSALDSESEKTIQESINRIKHKYTIIAIAHRLSTIENSDSIIVIDKGRVVETGIHNELIKAGGIYSKFYEIQYSTTNSVKHNDDFRKDYREIHMPKDET